ncbi:MAG: zinc-ribbon domain-containing protein, partial [Anaerolineales bacterium]
MDEILCAQCGQSNPPDAVFCQRCGALLPPQRPATEPLAPTLRPGEEPVKKSTAELEPLLPAWLRETRQSETPPPVEPSPPPAPPP